MNSLRTLIVVLGVVGLLLGCGSKTSAPAKKKQVRADTKAAPPAQEVGAATVPEEAPVEEAFVFDPTGLRDPFEPFVKLEPKKKKVEKKVLVPKTPLQRYAVEELRIVGVVWADAGKSKALIEDPEGKGYVVGVGTLVGDQEGKIIRIHPEKVMVEERFIDLLGEENVRVITMSLHKPEGEVSP